MYVCACDMLSWNAHCIGIVNLWLWMHAVVVSDAITPIMRKKIGLHSKLLALPVVSFVLVQAVIMYDLVADGGLGLKDRKLFHVVVGNRQIEFRVVPFFVSRLGTTFAWSLVPLVVAHLPRQRRRARVSSWESRLWVRSSAACRHPSSSERKGVAWKEVAGAASSRMALFVELSVTNTDAIYFEARIPRGLHSTLVLTLLHPRFIRR